MIRLGIDIGGTSVKFGIVDEQFHILEQTAIPTLADRSAEALIDDIVTAAKPLIDKYDPVTVGVGSPGSVNPQTGMVFAAGNLPFHNIPLAKLLQDALGLPIRLENDANCALIAEATAGVCHGCRDALIITIGTGIGGAILIDGKVYHGHNFLAGELGHFVIQHGGLQCPCGLRGCFEQYASATALICQTQEAIDAAPESILAQIGAADVDGRTVFSALEKGCPVADRVLQTYLGYLAAGINGLTYIFQPQKIALAGGVAKAGAVLTDRLQPLLIRHANVALSSLSGNGGILGAAILPAFQQ